MKEVKAEIQRSQLGVDVVFPVMYKSSDHGKFCTSKVRKYVFYTLGLNDHRQAIQELNLNRPEKTVLVEIYSELDNMGSIL